MLDSRDFVQAHVGIDGFEVLFSAADGRQIIIKWDREHRYTLKTTGDRSERVYRSGLDEAGLRNRFRRVFQRLSNKTHCSCCGGFLLSGNGFLLKSTIK